MDAIREDQTTTETEFLRLIIELFRLMFLGQIVVFLFPLQTTKPAFFVPKSHTLIRSMATLLNPCWIFTLFFLKTRRTIKRLSLSLFYSDYVHWMLPKVISPLNIAAISKRCISLTSSRSDVMRPRWIVRLWRDLFTVCSSERRIKFTRC